MRDTPAVMRKKTISTIHTFTLPLELTEAIQALRRDAANFLGRPVSSAAIVRALIRYVTQQGPAVVDALFLEVERELKAGVRWGKKTSVRHQNACGRRFLSERCGHF